MDTKYTILAVALGTLAILGVYIATSSGLGRGAFSDTFLSIQLATDPDNGECLTTDGTDNVWSSSCGGGSSFGQAWQLVTNVFSQSALAPTTTQNIAINGVGTSTFAGGLEAWRQIAAPYFHATSTTATSTFDGDVKVTGTSHLYTHGIQATDSQGIHLHSNNGTEVAFFGAGGGTGVTLSGYTDALLQTGVAGAIAEYTGTSCTNQFVRSLSALGVATCETVANTDLANSSVSYGGVSVSLGGSDATPAFDLTDATGLPLTTGVTGTLPIANGGTATTTFYDGGITFYNSSLGTLSQAGDGVGLYWDETNGNLGIGTTSPYAKLSVVGETVASHFTATTSATSTFPNINVSGAADLFGTYGTALSDFCTAITGSADLCDGNDASGGGSFGQAWEIDGSGNLAPTTTVTVTTPTYFGVGTSSPWAKFAVNPVAGDTNQFVVGSSTATSFLINNAGNVGVGEISPLYRLDVHAIFPSRNDAQIVANFDRESSGGTGQGGIGSVLNFRVENAAGSFSTVGQMGAFLGSSTNNGDGFSIMNKNGVQVLNVTTAENVGIGNFNPGSKLHISNTGSANDVLLVQDSSGTCEAQPTTTGLTWSCSSDERLKFDISTTTRSALAEIVSIPLYDYKVRKTGEQVYDAPVAQKLLETQYAHLVDYDKDADEYRVSTPNMWNIVRAIQEIYDYITQNRQRIETLEAQVADLEARLQALEK